MTQAALSFGVALVAVLIGIVYLPVDAWTRLPRRRHGFLVSSAFTSAQCVRDAHETSSVAARLDQARVDKLLADHDPFTSL